MNEVFKIFLSLSLSGSLMILILFLCKYFWKDKISRQWQYYIWLIVLARLLFPFASETNLIGSIFQNINHKIIQTDIIPQQHQQDNLQDIKNAPTLNIKQNGQQENNPPIQPFGNQPIQDITALLANNIWLVWLVIALIMLIRKITVYQSFVRYVKAGQILASDIELLDQLSVLAWQAGIKKPVELCVNPLISSPLLIGFFRPYIVLASTDISKKDFRYTILHELTHFRRRDMFYKWLVQVTVCLHWFNPLVYVMSQEINKACEFSCDEAIIAKLDYSNVQEYGKTLLDAMSKAGNYKESMASVTLNENKKMLKERLGAIMSFKKKSMVVKVCTAILTLALCFSTTIIGAYASDVTNSQDIWVVDGEEMDHLPEELEKELAKDPVVRELLDLEDVEDPSNNSPEQGDDIWVVDDEEMDQLMEELENELRKDPIVREQLGLEDVEDPSNNSPEQGDDIWVVDDEEMDQLMEELENELRKDPIVREQLGLEDIEEESSSSLDTNNDNNSSNKENSSESISNSLTPITSIDGTDINNVLIFGENLGIVIETSPTNKFEFDYVGVNDTNNFSFDYTINSDGTLIITASADSSVNYISTNLDNKVNVVNIEIPEKIYDNFTLNIQKGGLYLPNIQGNVNIDSEKSLIKVAANQFEATLKLNLKKSSLKFDVTGISNNINVIGLDTGNSVTMVFNEAPKSLSLNATKCKGSVILPDGWSTDYRVGTNKPIINLDIKGSTTITVK